MGLHWRPPTTHDIDRAVEFAYRSRFTGTPRSRLLGLLGTSAEIWHAVRVLLTLPVVDVTTPTRQWRPPAFYSPFCVSRGWRRLAARALFALRRPQVRLGQAVLRLPESFEDYLRGRSRQAVRTNCTRARRLGMVVRPVASEAAGLRMIEAIVYGDSAERAGARDVSRSVDPRRPTRGLTTLAVHDAGGAVVGVAAYYRSGDFVRLEALKCTASEQGAVARYLLHTGLVELLIADGVRLLLADSGIWVTPGVRYLQQRIGYDVVNLRIRPTSARRPATVRRIASAPRTPTERSRGEARHRRSA